MSEHNDAASDMHRLYDIEVEEVSIVDHAANKHRFLIVKRSDDMKDDNTRDTEQNDAADSEHDDHAEHDDHEEDETDNNAVGEPAQRNAATLTVAVDALEGLTEAVELLGTESKDDTMSRFSDLAGELRDVAETLADMAGAADRESDTASSSRDEDSDNSSALPEAIDAVRATLQQVGAMLRSQRSAPDAQTAVKTAKTGKTAKPERADKASPGVANEQLKALTSELRSLAATVKKQQTRLARLEKRSGLPNSNPAGEQRKRTAKGATDDNEGWPLDMNSAFDRDSVDKSTSFHDV